jgi:hypothetical protein
MKNSNFLLKIFIMTAVFFMAETAYAWTDPTLAPPGGNVSAPVNVSSSKQIKAGSLGVGGADPVGYGMSVAAAVGNTAAIKTVFSGDTGYVMLSSNVCRYISGSWCDIVAVTGATHTVGVEVSGNSAYGVVGQTNKIDGVGVGGFGGASGYGVWAQSSGDLGTGLYADALKKAVAASNASAKTTVYLGYKSDTISASPNVYSYGVYSEVGVAPFTGVTPMAMYAKYDASNYAQIAYSGYGIRARGSSYAGYFDGNVTITGNTSISGGTSISGALKVGGGCTGCTADIAEAMNVQEKVEAGDIVATGKDLKLIKAKNTDSTVVGVVSTTPFMTLNETNAENGSPLALTGIVDVKVNNENGQIKAGDFIVASSTPGVGMKAVAPSTTVGKALQDFNSVSGKIKILASVSWFAGANCK